VRLGLLKGRVPTLIKEEAYKKFFMHRTGHWLGMDVHDVGDYKVGDEPGACSSPECASQSSPASIFRPGHARRAPRFWNIGVRIEDDVAVTADGPEILTDGLPRTPAEVERAMGA
jgi:Xaa-Pro aminopeptidase